MGAIQYAVERDLDADEAYDCYVASTLAERRPFDDRDRLSAALRGADLIVTARDDGLLVGLARSLSDFAVVTYVADLAVRESHQRSGIGRGLVLRIREEAPRTKLVLLAAPAARDYYPRIGFEQHPSAWWLREDMDVGGT